MVQTMLYTSEQISIPETLPNILKTYAKAAIRTQPYDLLRWSAAYFRCLANNVLPPVKLRMEKGAEHGTLTKGYLKVLVDQVGKGYFISRKLLQQRWSALCLPEEELFKYLSLCRMLNWPQLHWLKVFAVMAGSLTDSPHETVNLICEILTDDVAGSQAQIPMWMFRVCYSFIAELDCSEEQQFVDGRKKLSSGELESEVDMQKIPQVLSTTSLRDAIFDYCKQRYNDQCGCNKPKEEEKICESSSSSASIIGAPFQFLDDILDPKKAIQKYGDFDSLILLLREAQGATLRNYRGPYAVTEYNIDAAKERQEGILIARENQAEAIWDRSRKFIYQDTVNMLRDLGPPWTWLHQFAGEGCIDKSYNFVDEQSVISDKTPSQTSNESFDFVKETPVPHISPSTSSLSSGIKEATIRNVCANQDDSLLELMRSHLTQAESQGKLTRKPSSVVTFMQYEFAATERAGDRKTLPISVLKVIDALEAAERNGITFENIDAMIDYLKDLEDKEAAFTATTRKSRKSSRKVDVVELKESSSSTKLSDDANIVASGDSVTATEYRQRGGQDKPGPPKQKITGMFEGTDLLPGAEFVEAGLCPIFGLEPKPDEEPSVWEEEDVQSDITPSGDVTERGYASDISSKIAAAFSDSNADTTSGSNILVHDGDQDTVCSLRGYTCTVPPYPGIGRPVSKRTIQDFLTYLKMRSRQQAGMIMPWNFKEPKCPHMLDCCQTLHKP